MPEKQASLRGWIVCMTASLFFFYIFIQMMLFNATGHQISVDFHLNSSQFGALSSFYFWGNVIFLFPAGLLLDRLSVKLLIILSMLVVILATLWFSVAHTASAIIMCRLLIGIAGAFALITGLRMAANWFPPHKLAFVSGLIITMGFLGGLVAQTPITMLLEKMNWREVMQVVAGLGGVILIIMLILLKDKPKENTEKEKVPGLEFLWYSIKKSIVNRQNWLFGLYTCLINIPIFVFGASFGIMYLTQGVGLSSTTAANITSTMFIGAMIGSPLFGWVSDKMKLRKLPMYFGSVLSLISIFLIMYYHTSNIEILMVLFFALGLFTSSQVISYPAITESNPEKITGAALSIGSTLIMGGGAVFLPIYGWLLNLTWKGHMLHGAPWHSLHDYRMALWMLPTIIVIGTIGIFFTKETRCKNISE